MHFKIFWKRVSFSECSYTEYVAATVCVYLYPTSTPNPDKIYTIKFSNIFSLKS